MTTKHIHHDVIIEWAKGATIQYYNNERNMWMDCPHAPLWGLSSKYRVKPVTKKYRVCLLGDVVLAVNPESMEKNIEKHRHFNRWLTDWIEYEV